MTGVGPRAARLRRWAGPRALALALTVALPAGGVALPASAVAEGELPPAPDPVPVPAPAATPAPALAPIAGLPTLPGPPAPAGVDASPAAVAQQAVPAPTVAAAAAALAAPAAAVAAALRPLRMGAVGADVRELQRALRRRGVRIAIDGAYGRGTRAAVARVQRKMARRATGVADVALLKALGVAPQAPAADLGVKSAAVTDVTGAAIAGLGLPEGAPPAPVSAEALGAHFLRTFPIAGPHAYSDDFGAPRPQGAHQGVDILSPLGTPVVAVAAGAVERLSRSESGRGGITIWMRDTAGNVFFYAHLASIADGLQDGTPVAIGQQIGTVGNTGDARGGPTHLHFELHPGGNGAVDPFNELTTVDPDKAVQTPASLTPRRPARAR